jgi:ribose 5-phosphate isomerase B
MIYLGTDHRGYKLKEKIKEWLPEWGYEYEDMGAHEYNEKDDYPDFISLVGEKVSADPDAKGIILGGSGQGEAVVANKYKGVRAVVYYGGLKEMIIHTREHDNANVLSLAADFIDESEAQEIIKLWLETSFPGEERHVRRLKKVKQLEE